MPLMFSYLEVFPYEWSGLFRLWAKSEFLSSGSWINDVRMMVFSLESTGKPGQCSEANSLCLGW